MKISYDYLPLLEDVENEPTIKTKHNRQTLLQQGTIDLDPRSGESLIPQVFYMGILIDKGVSVTFLPNKLNVHTVSIRFWYGGVRKMRGGDGDESHEFQFCSDAIGVRVIVIRRLLHQGLRQGDGISPYDPNPDRETTT